ncbi:hypothetical protein HH303_07725 [Rhodospirillaceae bacterium KN72]|uniref:Uncharacterized protein n=1 Tax=Pacificispira spongiicola TaxID=2729598 RepID=A0A7Y0HF99_9PROT|nr:hypothetical protein [Pacificispira spongiicola]NMM44363.1 hypothetical protein [Pacificispira spongiicola]
MDMTPAIGMPENGHATATFFSRIKSAMGILILPTLLAGCASITQSNGEIDNPVQRRAVWFSFISGEDIQRSCASDGRERYRLVYIADRTVQVRIYDIDPLTTPSPQQRSRVMTVAASDWFPWAITEDVTRPFRPHTGITNLSDADMDALRTAFAQDGLGTRAPPIGRKIADTSYSWMGSACIGGTFHFQAWEYPDADYTGLRFPEMLFAKDPTGIRIEPSPTDGKRRVYDRFKPPVWDNDPWRHASHYNMEVHETGVTISD